MAEKEDKKDQAEDKKENEEGTGDADNATEGTGEATDESEGGGGSKSKKKRLIIIIASVLVLILIPVGIYFSGIIPAFSFHKKSNDAAQSTPVEKEKIKWVFFDMDEMLVNLNTGGKYASFLKAKISLEIPEKNIEIVKANIPKIQDSFIVYLREVREEDLKRSVGLYRLREELLLRANEITYPIKVNDVLFREFIIQ